MLAGLAKRDRLKKRSELLEEVRLFVITLGSGIRFGLVPPDEAICAVKCTSDSFFGICRGNILGGMNVTEAWLEAADSCRQMNYLKKDEAELVRRLGSQIGIYDARQQLAVLSEQEERLARISSDAREEYIRQSRLYMSCCPLAGTAAALLII